MNATAFAFLALLTALQFACSGGKYLAQAASVEELGITERSESGVPFVVSKLTIAEVRNLVSTGITLNELRSRISSVPIISFGGALYTLKDGQVRISSHGDQNEKATGSSVVISKSSEAEGPRG